MVKGNQGTVEKSCANCSYWELSDQEPQEGESRGTICGQRLFTQNEIIQVEADDVCRWHKSLFRKRYNREAIKTD